ncbi:MAG: hypothetical protein Q7U60_08735 [Candidatus Methanoperedens sp.]|nr:hypothetical protein [Candidatus Methanoperedens sp.]
MSYTRKEIQDISDELGQPMVVIKDGGLTSEEKKTVKKIMLRNDRALRILADM